MTANPAAHKTDPAHTSGQQLGLWISGFLAVCLVGWAMYYTVQSGAQLARAHGAPQPDLAPILVEGTLVVVVVLDLMFTWIRNPVVMLRWTARMFTIGSVAIAVAAGWPDFASIGFRAAASFAVLVIVEAVRSILMRRIRAATRTDPIPRSRWMADPLGSFRMRRRMALWGETSYARALETERQRRHAIELLKIVHGALWETNAPGDLVWMLRSGAFPSDAFARVRELHDAFTDARERAFADALERASADDGADTEQTRSRTPRKRPQKSSRGRGRGPAKASGGRHRTVRADAKEESADDHADAFTDESANESVNAAEDASPDAANGGEYEVKPGEITGDLTEITRACEVVRANPHASWEDVRDAADVGRTRAFALRKEALAVVYPDGVPDASANASGSVHEHA